MESSLPSSAADSTLRLTSLDVFRGMTIGGMVLVNNPGDWNHVYAPLEHAPWHGWTPTDLIFPFFLFIVGVAIPFSFAKRISQGATRPRLFLHILERSAVLFVLGMILTGLPDYDFSHRLILDVLQRIAIVYILAASIVIWTNLRLQVVIAAACLAVYWLLMTLVPVPGYGAGVLGPEGNLWQYVDTMLIKGWHYHAEGILSLIPSISTVLFGTFAGYWIRSDRGTYQKAAGLFVFGNIGLVLGLVADVWFPINKLLWSSSYVLFTAGFALNALGCCFWLIDIKGYRAWSKPFLVFGKNAIALFFLSSLVGRLMGLITIAQSTSASPNVRVTLKSYLYMHVFAGWTGEFNSSLFYAITYLSLWWLVMAALYKKRLFIKI